jgi:predicted dienelactone hydrolase
MDMLKKVVWIAVIFIAAGFVRRADASVLGNNNVAFDVAHASTEGGSILLSIWYPTSATPQRTPIAGGMVLEVAPKGAVTGEKLPLVLISHGNGGSGLGHVDLAMALAHAGFVVVAPTHPGDNYADTSAQGAADLYSRRNRQLRSTLDYMLGQWPSASTIDSNRIGAFGMSAGAFTVLTLAGGQPRMQAISKHCAKDPEFICRALAELKSPLLVGADGSGAFAADSRIKAVAIAAPGLGFTFQGSGLKDVRVPVQLWIGDRDDTVPASTNAAFIQRELGSLVETHVVPGAAHVSFLAPCGELKLPTICTDPDGFDRVAAHAAMDAQVVGFFETRLPKAAAR